MSLLETKEYPKEYPAEAVKVLNTMTFTTKASGLQVVGSNALRSQLYAGDYDGYEVVEASSVPELVQGFKRIIKNLKTLNNSHIMDIKSGEVEDWRVVPLKRSQYKVRKAMDKIESLLKDGIISSEEAKDAEKTLSSYTVAKQEIKFHIVRWTPEEVLEGHKELRDGSDYTLEDAFTSNSITKLDVVALVKGVYREFSVIYEFKINGKTINKVPDEPLQSLKESLEYYKETKNPYKVLKRKFSLAKLKNDLPALKRLSKIINSDLGKVYLLYSDVKTLGDVLDSDLPFPSDFKKRIQILGLPKPLMDDLMKIKSKKDIGILRHIEEQLLNDLSKGTVLKGGYVPYKP